MGTTSSALFTGSSQFSGDFQNIITRAVNIASLPITQLTDSLTSLQSQTSALSTLDTKFAALQTSITGIQNAVGGASFETIVSDPDLVDVSLGEGVIEGNYSIEVVDAGAYSTSQSTRTWNNIQNPPGEAHTYELWIGSQSDPKNKIEIRPEDNSALTVAAAIDAKAGAKVRAVAVNIGSSSEPDWRISLTSTTLGDIPVDIVDGGESLQTQTAGREATYIVNNSGHPVTSNSRSVSITQGLTVNLKASGDPVNITVTRSTSALGDALSAFADAYNATVDAIDAQRGSSAGALSGQSLIRSLSSALSGMATWPADGMEVSGLRDLGLELGADGHLTFNSLQLFAADFSNSAGVTAFFGTIDGGGFLKSVTDLLASVQDPLTGLLPNAKAGVQSQIDDTNNRISAKQAQVADLEERLIAQMSAADAAIASMEQQYSYLASMFESMRVASQQYS